MVCFSKGWLCGNTDSVKCCCMANHFLCSCERGCSCGDDKVFCSSQCWSCANTDSVMHCCMANDISCSCVYDSFCDKDHESATKYDYHYCNKTGEQASPLSPALRDVRPSAASNIQIWFALKPGWPKHNVMMVGAIKTLPKKQCTTWNKSSNTQDEKAAKLRNFQNKTPLTVGLHKKWKTKYCTTRCERNTKHT